LTVDVIRFQTDRSNPVQNFQSVTCGEDCGEIFQSITGRLVGLWPYVTTINFGTLHLSQVALV